MKPLCIFLSWNHSYFYIVITPFLFVICFLRYPYRLFVFFPHIFSDQWFIYVEFWCHSTVNRLPTFFIPFTTTATSSIRRSFNDHPIILLLWLKPFDKPLKIKSTRIRLRYQVFKVSTKRRGALFWFLYTSVFLWPC